MPDFHRNVRLATDRDRLLERLDLAVGLVADMGRVNSAVARGDLGQGDQLRRLGVGARRINECGRDTAGSLLHRGLGDSFHLR